MTKKRWKEIKDKAEGSLDHVRTHAKHEIVELINEIERLQEVVASWEAQWYDCHDGSESACCKAHE